MLRIAVVLFAMLTPVSALGASWMPNCQISEDGSTLEVIASNPSAKKYYCQAWCRMKITGERPVQKFDCTFNLGANATEKVMCRKDGGKPAHFSEVLPTKSTCVPR